MTQEALKLALDALETELSIDWGNQDEFNASAEKMHEAIAAIKEALAQKQKPVAIRHSFDGYGYKYTDMGFGSNWIGWTKRQYKDSEPLYTHSQRTWVGLTDMEKQMLINKHEGVAWEIANAVEQQTKEKNK